jgi:hypothetical protein
VGGGLTGILAAFEAHRLGARDIELNERFDELGGELLPKVRHGLEMRDRCFYFGGPDDPARQALEWAGASFQDVDLGGGSVRPGPHGEALSVDEAAPHVIASGQADPGGRSPETLADRLRALPHELEAPLSRYCQWRLGVWLDEVHESAVTPLGVASAGAKATALPRDGFADLFRACRRKLEGLGVDVRLERLVSPGEAIEACGRGALTVWTADPTPLLAAFDLGVPKPVAPTVASYIFKTRSVGLRPFVIRNFTAAGSVFRVHLYESRGEILAAVDCVAETEDAELRRHVHGLTAEFGCELVLGEQLAADVRAASGYQSMESRRRLKILRFRLAQQFRGRFVPGAWDAPGPAARFADLRQALSAVLTPDVQPRASAA